MSWIRRYPARALLVVGTVIAAQSVLWEWVRMRPDYRFLVEPWSLRGLRLTQGRVVAILAIGILLLAVLSWSRTSERLGARASWIVGGIVIVAASVIAFIAAPDAREYSPSTIHALAIGYGAALTLTMLYRDLIARRLGGRWIYSTVLVYLVVANVLFVVLRGVLVDEQIEVGLWLIVALGLAVAFLPAVISPPAELGVNRILILSVALAWFVEAVSAGAARSTLVRLQLEAAGTAAQYKDVQITSGMILAFIGFALAFVGAVAIWAQRRDQIAALQRARQQRAAAEDSLAELATQ